MSDIDKKLEELVADDTFNSEDWVYPLAAALLRARKALLGVREAFSAQHMYEIATDALADPELEEALG